MGGDEKVVPKFASYTAKKLDTKSSPNASQTEPRAAQSRDARTNRHKTESANRHNNRSFSSQHAHHGSKRPIVAERQSREHSSIDQDRLTFTVDTKGDVDNVTFQGANKWKIPKYQRAGASLVLGARPRIKFKALADKDVSMLKPGAVTDSLRPILGRKHLRFPEAKRLRPMSEPDAILGFNEDYINLQGNESPARDAKVSSMELIRDLAFDDSEPAEDSESPMNNDVDVASTDRAILERNAELNRAVRDDPSSVKGWLELADFREQLARSHGDESSANSSRGAQRRKLAELRISILEDALKQTSNHATDRELLWLQLLSDCRYTCDFEVQANKWQRAVEDCGQNRRIRLGKLDFTQRSYLRYGLEACRQEFRAVSAFFQGQLAQTDVSAERQSIIEAQSYVMLRYTVFLEQSGYHELAFAVWQSALDYVCSHSRKPDNSVKSFAVFWDSEVARLGEGAKAGWSTYEEGDAATKPYTADDGSLTDKPATLENLSRVGAVALREKEFMVKSCLPGRVADMDEEMDAFHVVVSEDVTGLLGNLITDKTMHVVLATAFTCFLNLSKPLNISKNCESWWNDPWTVKRPLTLPTMTNDLCLAESVSPAGRALDTIACLLRENRSSQTSKAGKRRHDVVIRILRTLDEQVENRILQMPIVTAVLKWNGIDAAAKEAKRLLKADSTNIAVYQTLFAIEIARGNHQVAERIISTPIRMRQSFSINVQDEFVQLWRTWIWHHFVNNDTTRALQLLLSLDTLAYVDESSREHNLQAASVLKSEQYIEGAIRRALHLEMADSAVSAIEVAMLLEYFKHSKSLPSAMQYLNTKMALISAGDVQYDKMMERLHQGRTDIIAHHAKHVRSYQPSEIQMLLRESMELFPDNGLFLKQYVNQQLTFSLDERLRGAMMMSAQDEHNSVNRWLSLIGLENTRCEKALLPQHSTRAIFERAVESHSGEMSSAIWSSYIDFEKMHGTIDQFQSVLNRAMTKLPWIKDFVLEGLIHLDGKVSNDELEQLYALLGERDIRMVCSLE